MSEEEKKTVKKEEKKPEEKKNDKIESSSKSEKRCSHKGMGIFIILILVLGGVYYYSSNKNGGGLMGGGLSNVQEVNAEDMGQWSYSVGATLGAQLEMVLAQAQQSGDVDRAVVAQAIRDVLMKSEDVPMTKEQVEEVLKAREGVEQEKMEAKAQENAEKGVLFMAEYEKSDDVVKAENGSLYKVIEKGSGALVGTKAVMVEYEGMFTDRTQFDSSSNHGGEPVRFTSEGLIPGLGEVMELMRVGDTWEVVIPHELAYGEMGQPGVIEPNETLIFKLTIVELADV